MRVSHFSFVVIIINASRTTLIFCCLNFVVFYLDYCVLNRLQSNLIWYFQQREKITIISID